MGPFTNFHILIIIMVYIITPGLADWKEDGEYKNVSRALPCPDPIQIYPCTCSVDEYMHMNMDCSNVTSEDQLKAVFSTELPFKDFYYLKIFGNQHLVSLRENDLGDATFQVISIINGILEVVESRALIGSASTAIVLNFNNNEITFFPFEEMTLYNKLNTLDVGRNQISTYPRIESQTINHLDLPGNQIRELPADALQTLPNIEIFHFSGNPVKEILPGTFTGFPMLRAVDLGGCELTYISPFLIEFESWYGLLDISDNQIVEVAANAITGATDFIFLENNQLTELKGEVWLPVMESGSRFDIRNNPLLCGCDIAWLILNPTYMEKLDGDETCSDGEFLIDLDPAIYENFC